MKIENMEEKPSQLFREAQEGSNRAWNTLVERFQKRVMMMALVITKNIPDADDATQEAFVSLYNNMDKIREPEKVEGWLIKAAINKAKDINRKTRVREWLPLFKTQVSEPSTAEDSVYSGELSKILKTWKENKLSEKEQLVFQLRFGEEKEISEISGLLGMNLNTVKTHLYRAMKKLKHEATKLIKESSDEK